MNTLNILSSEFKKNKSQAYLRASRYYIYFNIIYRIGTRVDLNFTENLEKH